MVVLGGHGDAANFGSEEWPERVKEVCKGEAKWCARAIIWRASEHDEFHSGWIWSAVNTKEKEEQALAVLLLYGEGET